MTHPNAQTIRKGFDAFLRGDSETARSIFAPDVIWHVSGRCPLSGDFRGFAAIAAWGAQLYVRSGGTFAEELVDIVADDAWAVQLAVYRAERNGRKIQDRSVNVFRMVNGLVAECWVYFGDPNGFDEFWS